MTNRIATLRFWGAAALAAALVVACGSSGESPGESSGDTGFNFDIFSDSSPGEGGGDDVTDDTLEDAEEDALPDADPDVEADVEQDVEQDVENDAESDADAEDDAGDNPDTTTDVAEETGADADSGGDADLPDAPDVEEDPDVMFADIDVDLPDPADHEISLLDTSALPAILTIDAGEVVRFINRGVAAVEVAAEDDSWETGLIPAGGSADLEFEVGGTFPYGPAFSATPWGTIIIRSPILEGDYLVEMDIASGEGLTYQPSMLEIEPGETVVWENSTDDRTLSIESDTGLFESGALPPGFRFAYTFEEPGTFVYFDSPTMSVSGVITVIAPPEPADYEVSIGDAYDPAELFVEVGETVRWTNNDTEAHSVTTIDMTFDSGALAPGETFSWTAATAGSLRYTDTVSRDRAYTGRITVLSP